jgi:hypothetical protein
MSPDTCFVCAKVLTNKNRTKEDVIPLWIQRRFDLMNQYCNLLNNTDIQYKNLKIPCCNECNNEHLSRLEKIVQEAVTKGFEATLSLPEGYIYQWLTKIYVGLLYRELFLQVDRSQRNNRSITTPESLNNVKILWLWLQLSFSSKKAALRAPGSVFTFQCYAPDRKEEQFDMLDDFFSDCIAMRVGEVGLVVDLLDNHLHWDSMWPYLKKYQAIKLHPLQFRELAVKIFCKARLLDLEIEIIAENKDDDLVEIKFKPESKVDGKNLFRKWDYEEYARMLSDYTGVPLEKIFFPNDKVWTWLQDKSGNLIDVTKMESPNISFYSDADSPRR